MEDDFSFQISDSQVPCYVMGGGVTIDPNFLMDPKNDGIRWTILKWWHLVFLRDWRFYGYPSTRPQMQGLAIT